MFLRRIPTLAATVLSLALGISLSGCSTEEAEIAVAEIPREQLLSELHLLADGKPIPKASDSEEAEGKEGHGEAESEHGEKESAGHGEKEAAGHGGGHGGGHGAEVELGPLLEDGIRFAGNGKAELGWYRAGVFEPASRLALQAEFRLVASTRAKDADEFAAFIAPRQHALREQVLLTMRGAKPAELYRADLDRLAARILIALGRVAGEAYFTAVTVEDFVLLESLDGAPFHPAEPQKNPQASEHPQSTPSSDSHAAHGH